jgi:hypothetical protein
MMTSYQPKELPLDAQGFVQSFALEDSEGSQAFFDEFGFVVVDNVLSKKECEDTINEIWALIEGFCGGKLNISRDHPPSWRKRWPGGGPGLLGQATTQQAWLNRANPNLRKVFEQLVGTTNLVSSVDNYGVLRPTKKVPMRKLPPQHPCRTNVCTEEETAFPAAAVPATTTAAPGNSSPATAAAFVDGGVADMAGTALGPFQTSKAGFVTNSLDDSSITMMLIVDQSIAHRVEDGVQVAPLGPEPVAVVRSSQRRRRAQVRAVAGGCRPGGRRQLEVPGSGWVQFHHRAQRHVSGGLRASHRREQNSRADRRRASG